jgi:hypothetical protein
MIIACEAGNVSSCVSLRLYLLSIILYIGGYSSFNVLLGHRCLGVNRVSSCRTPCSKLDETHSRTFFWSNDNRLIMIHEVRFRYYITCNKNERATSAKARPWLQLATARQRAQKRAACNSAVGRRNQRRSLVKAAIPFISALFLVAANFLTDGEVMSSATSFETGNLCRIPAAALNWAIESTDEGDGNDGFPDSNILATSLPCVRNGLAPTVEFIFSSQATSVSHHFTSSHKDRAPPVA